MKKDDAYGIAKYFETEMNEEGVDFVKTEFSSDSKGKFVQLLAIIRYEE